MSSEHRFTAADALLLLTALIWGVNFSVVKFALSELPPLAFNTIRFSAAGAVMTAAILASGQHWRFERRHLPGLLALGLLGNAAYQLVFIFGAAATTADNTALILATVPAWVALAGSLAGLERLRPAAWLGVGLSLLGIGLIVLGSDRAAHLRFGGATLRGDALILLCTLCWSAYTLLTRPAVRRYGVLSVTSFCTLTGAVPLVLLGLPQLASATASPAVWAAAVQSGVCAVALAYLFWNYGVARLGSARTALYANLTPPIALLTAWLGLGETLTPIQGAGALVVVAGVVLARRHASARQP